MHYVTVRAETAQTVIVPDLHHCSSIRVLPWNLMLSHKARTDERGTTFASSQNYSSNMMYCLHTQTTFFIEILHSEQHWNVERWLFTWIGEEEMEEKIHWNSSAVEVDLISIWNYVHDILLAIHACLSSSSIVLYSRSVLQIIFREIMKLDGRITSGRGVCQVCGRSQNRQICSRSQILSSLQPKHMWIPM